MDFRSMSEKESLAIISNMMQETREYIHKGVGNFQLLWGYLSVSVSLVVYFGWHLLHSPWVMAAWWLIPLVGWPSLYLMTRRHPKRVVTIIDRIIGKVWIVIGITATLIPLFKVFDVSNSLNILFVEALLISIGISITGLIINFKTFYIPGFISILLSSMLLWVNGLDQILVFALIFAIMLVIPGHIINYQVNKKTTLACPSEN